MILAPSLQAFQDADLAWFAENPNRTFRYHLLSRDDIEQYIPGLRRLTDNGASSRRALIVAYIPQGDPDGVSYFVPSFLATEGRPEDAATDDLLGVWLVRSHLTWPHVEWGDVVERGSGVEQVTARPDQQAA